MPKKLIQRIRGISEVAIKAQLTGVVSNRKKRVEGIPQYTQTHITEIDFSFIYDEETDHNKAHWHSCIRGSASCIAPYVS